MTYLQQGGGGASSQRVCAVPQAAGEVLGFHRAVAHDTPGGSWFGSESAMQWPEEASQLPVRRHLPARCELWISWSARVLGRQRLARLRGLRDREFGSRWAHCA